MRRENNLSNGILTVLISNIYILVLNVLTSFLLPKFLSVDSYAQIKTFQLYIGYAGLLHLGYVDGMYVRNGGKELGKLNKKDLSSSISTLRTTQLIISFALLIVSLFRKDAVFLAFALAVLPINMTAYFQHLFSAVGEFSKYGLLIKATTIATFIANISLLFLFRSDRSSLYFAAYVLIDYIIWFILEISMHRTCRLEWGLRSFRFSELKENIRNGILLTLGNLSSDLFTGMDRWFVKILLSTADFAQYSFAASTEHFINAMMTPVSVTLYNHFCKGIDEKGVKQIRNYVTIFAVFVIAAAFPAKFIVKNFLGNYSAAVNIIFYLFSAHIFFFPVKCVYINLYKAHRKQRLYFIKLLLAIAAGFIFNAGCFAIMHNKEAMAIGTVLSAIFWWILCVLDFREISYKAKDIAFMIIELVAFNICGAVFSSILGCIVYIAFSLVMAVLLVREDFFGLIKFGTEMLCRRLGRGNGRIHARRLPPG